MRGCPARHEGSPGLLPLQENLTESSQEGRPVGYEHVHVTRLGDYSRPASVSSQRPKLGYPRARDAN